jgi:hypothetical protein
MTDAAHYGRGYGLLFRSEIPLPPLPESPPGSPDVLVRLDEVPPLGEGAVDFSHSHQYTPDSIRIQYPDTGPIKISGGREIVASPPDPHRLERLRVAILGPAVAFLLHQRGFLVLHASAIVHDGQAVLLLGFSGTGKSTIAGALIQRGHALISDDVVAVDTEALTPRVTGGYPELKMWPDSLLAIGEKPDSLRRLLPDREKRSRPVVAFEPGPLPVGAIYVIELADRAEVRELSPSEALVELVRHCYVSGLLPLGEAERHMHQSASLLRQCRVRRLLRPASLDRLPELLAVLEADLGAG